MNNPYIRGGCVRVCVCTCDCVCVCVCMIFLNMCTVISTLCGYQGDERDDTACHFHLDVAPQRIGLSQKIESEVIQNYLSHY